MKTKLYTLLFSLCATMSMVGACKKASLDIHEAVSTPTVTVTDIKSKVATINWVSNDAKVKKFVVTLSKSSTFATTVETDTISSDVKSFIMKNLDGNILYYARVQALTGDVLYDSHYGTVSFTSSAIETAFLLNEGANTEEPYALLKWTTPVEEGTPDYLTFGVDYQYRDNCG